MELLTRLKNLVASRRAASPDAARERERAEYVERTKPLGEFRCRVLMAIEGDQPRGPFYFNPPPSSGLGRCVSPTP